MRQKPKKKPRRFAEPWTCNMEQALMLVFDAPENPDWLVGAA